MANVRTIEVDETTADVLEARAAERGVSVAQVVADLVSSDDAPLALDSDDVVELERRWAAVEAGSATVPHDEVVRWLDSWGTTAFRPWRGR